MHRCRLKAVQKTAISNSIRKWQATKEKGTKRQAYNSQSQQQHPRQPELCTGQAVQYMHDPCMHSQYTCAQLNTKPPTAPAKPSHKNQQRCRNALNLFAAPRQTPPTAPAIPSHNHRQRCSESLKTAASAQTLYACSLGRSTCYQSQSRTQPQQQAPGP